MMRKASLIGQFNTLKIDRMEGFDDHFHVGENYKSGHLINWMLI
jgi:hypothetical protein